MMKKSMMALTASAVLLSSCGTYTGQGAFAGATFGSVLGSAIGGISGGWRGHDIGTVVGMAGGTRKSRRSMKPISVSVPSAEMLV